MVPTEDAVITFQIPCAWSRECVGRHVDDGWLIEPDVIQDPRVRADLASSYPSIRFVGGGGEGLIKPGAKRSKAISRRPSAGYDVVARDRRGTHDLEAYGFESSTRPARVQWGCHDRDGSPPSRPCDLPHPQCFGARSEYRIDEDHLLR